MQVTVNSANIETFGFTATFDIPNQRVIFDIAALTTFFGNGGTLIQGINFSLNDSSGNPLIAGNLGGATWDWDNPNIIVPSTDANPDYAGESTYILDLSAIWGNNYSILFQDYSIQGAIKDENGIVYQTTAVIKEVCQPAGLTDLGYVEGDFSVKADCANGFITVKDLTNVAYVKLLPISRVSNGSFFYPRGTIDPITWSGYTSPVNFANQIVYTGNYKVQNTTNCTYDLGGGFYVVVEYYTESEKYNITCEKHMLSVMCCVTETQDKIETLCTGSDADYLRGKMMEVMPYLWLGLENEASGRDSSEQALKVRQILNCKCNKKGIRQISQNPVNPLVYNIVVEGGWDTTVTPSVLGNTKTFTTKSRTFVTAKKYGYDNSFYIDTDTSVDGVVTYRIYFNYSGLSQTILNTIGDDETLLTLFNSLVWYNGTIDISNLNGKCIIDISAINYFLSQKVPTAATKWVSILIGSTTYTAPANLLASATDDVISWLNGLGVGEYSTSFSAGNGGYYINVLSVDNVYTPVSAVFNNTYGNTTTVFQKTTKNIVAFLQAITNYLCSLNDSEVVLTESVSLCYMDYNGEVATTIYPAGTTLQDLFAGFSSTICSLWSNISTSIGAESGIYKTIDTDGNIVFRLGENPLIEDTIIDLNNFALELIDGVTEYVKFGTFNNTILSAAGIDSLDVLSLFFNTSDKSVLQVSTNGDRNNISYYAKSHVEANGNSATIASYFPTTNNPLVPAPANDPDKTTKVQTGIGTILYYGKNQTVEGKTFRFDGTIPILPLLTTADRTALTATAGSKCFDIDFGAEMVFNGVSWVGFRYNSGTSKFEGFNGSAWVDLN